MEIHELNTFSGTLGSGDYFATDNGNDTSKISAEAMFAPLNERIDNIIAGGDAPSAAEVTDARLGADGVTYPSLGDAIRTQATNIKNAIELRRVIQYDNELYIDSETAFEQGNFTSSGDASSGNWIRTPSNAKLDTDFLIYNPNGLQWAIGMYFNNSWSGYDNGGQDMVSSGIYKDAIYHYNRGVRYKVRLRVSRYLASGALSPSQSSLKIYRKMTLADITNLLKGSGENSAVSVLVANGAILSGGTTASGDNYRYTDLIYLKSGDTLHFEYAGPSNVLALSRWHITGNTGNWSYVYDNALITCDGQYHVAEYTASENMYVRVSSMVAPVHNKPYVNAAEFLSNMFIFTAANYYDTKSPLYGKSITLMGDSLSYGSLCGNGAVWLQRLALEHNMTAHNLGINGNAITKGYGDGTPMCERYVNIQDSDYIVIAGGANDKNGSAPIGTFWSDEVNHVMNTNKTTFMGALNTIISGLRLLYPKAKLLFLTDYDRYPSKSNAYAEAMKEVCKMRSVPCFDNFSDSGVAVCEEGLKDWQDEGLWLGLSANYHFTPEVYKRTLLPKYEHFLNAI